MRRPISLICSEPIQINAVKRKIKLVNITDTSYLYRHGIQKFSEYCDTSIPTVWFLNNCETIEKLEVGKTIKAWADGLKSDEFKKWNRQIRIDFSGDNDGNGIVQRFRDIVMQESAVAVYKTGNALDDCIDFLLEECAYVCANLRNSFLVYPSNPPESVLNCVKRYNVNLFPVFYKISKQAKRSSKCYEYLKSQEVLDKEIALFMKKIVSNVNFFVIDKYGNHIYKNYAYSKIAGNINAKVFHQKAWMTNMQVMKTKKEIVVEETYGDTYFLSVKAPLIIDGEAEGIIGLSVDITKQKRAEKLQNELQQTKIEHQNRIKVISEQVAHDITSPLISLSSFAKSCEKLSEKDHIILRNIVTSIESICKKLLKEYEKAKDRSAELYISPYLSLLAVVGDKNIDEKPNITFNCSCDPIHSFVFMRGDYSDFCRMMSNLLNNSVEAVEKDKKGIVDVSFTVRDRNVEIYIKDNGKGMPKEIVGTEITLIFPECDPPKWLPTRIALHRGDMVVALDDDPSIFDIWERRFENYSDEITIKYFTQAQEAIDFINSLQDKSKLFLLTDYDLRDQKLNGVEVIEKSRMQNRSIVVTSVYISKIKEFNEKIDFIKLIPKPYIDKIPIAMRD